VHPLLRVARAARSADPVLLVVLAGAFALALIGIGWGLPNVESWSNDDVSPWTTLRVPKTYFVSDHKYPHLHPLLAFGLYAPYLLYLLATGGLDTACLEGLGPHCFSEPYTQVSVLILISRALSAVMAAGAVFACYHLALRLYRDVAAARIAAALFACCALLAYYAKVGNLDAPQVLWVTGSLWALVGVLRAGRRGDYVAFGLLAGLAVSMKEGIVGLYVGAGALVLFAHVRRAAAGGGARGAAASLVDRRLLELLGCGLAVYVVATNPVFNWSGFVAHWERWLPSSERMTGFREHSFVSYPDLAESFLSHFDEAVGLGPLLLCLAGLGWAAWRRSASLLLLIPAASYFALSIAPAGYAPARFVLPVVPILAVHGGLLGARLFRGGAAMRAVGAMVVGAALMHGAANALAGDLTMRADTRYAAEDWLRANLPPSAEVGTFAESPYLPRLEWLGFEVVQLPGEERGAAALEGAPEWLVLTSHNYPGLNDRRDGFVDALRGGELGYRVVFDERRQPALARWLGNRRGWIKSNPRIIVLRRDGAAVTTE